MPILLTDMSLNDTVAAGVLTTFCILLLLGGCVFCLGICWLTCFALWHTATDKATNQAATGNTSTITDLLRESQRIKENEQRQRMSLQTLFAKTPLGERVADASNQYTP